MCTIPIECLQIRSPCDLKELQRIQGGAQCRILAPVERTGLPRLKDKRATNEARCDKWLTGIRIVERIYVLIGGREQLDIEFSWGRIRIWIQFRKVENYVCKYPVRLLRWNERIGCAKHTLERHIATSGESILQHHRWDGHVTQIVNNPLGRS
jgi:hypothetical protein